MRDIYFSFFMFTVDLRPEDPAARAATVQRMERLLDLGYSGFDLPIRASAARRHLEEYEHYAALKASLDEAGLGDVPITTNVSATRTFDPTSEFAEQRAAALEFLKSRVDITALLGGSLMAGPFIFPYGGYPTTDFGDPIWSDALHAYVAPGYERARPVIEELASYADAQGVSLAIEPVDHWETAAPNQVGQVLDFLEGVPNDNVGVCVDSAHVVLSSDGPAAFAAQAARGRIHTVHVSAPDRGALGDSWIPWRPFFDAVLPVYDGPLLVEVFNAIGPFLGPLRITRRKFWIPDSDEPVPGVPDAYTVAAEALAAVREEIYQGVPR